MRFTTLVILHFLGCFILSDASAFAGDPDGAPDGTMLCLQTRVRDEEPEGSGQFLRELEDIAYFKRARVLLGTVVWPHEQDICRDTLYEDSVKVASVSAEQTDERETE